MQIEVHTSKMKIPITKYPKLCVFCQLKKKKQGNSHWIVGTYMFQRRSDPNSDPNWSPHVRIRVRRTK